MEKLMFLGNTFSSAVRSILLLELVISASFKFSKTLNFIFHIIFYAMDNYLA